MEPGARRRMFTAACSGMFCFGMAVVFLGPLFGLAAFREQLHITLVEQGTVLSLPYFSMLFATPVVGPVIDRFGHKLVFVISSLLIAASLAGFVFTESFAAAALGAVVLGLGGGGINIASNALTSEVFRDERGRYLNYLGVFFGFGALFVPLLAGQTGRLRLTPAEITWAAVAIAVGCAVAYAVLSFPAAREAHSFSAREVMQVARYPGVLLFALLLFFQSGDESVTTGWFPRYIGAMGAPEHDAERLLTALLVCIIPTRFAAAWLLKRITEAQLVLGALVLSLASYCVFWWAPSYRLQLIGAVLIGIAFAAVYPTTLAMVGNRYQRYAASVFSLIFTIALAGGMLFPWSIGKIAASYGLRTGMFLPIISRSIAIVLMLVIIAGEKRRAAA
jgi:fucose permease